MELPSLIGAAVIAIKNFIITKCDDCGNIISKIKKADNSNESAASLKAMPKYFEIGEINAANHVQISMGEPILVNPKFQKLKRLYWTNFTKT